VETHRTFVWRARDRNLYLPFLKYVFNINQNTATDYSQSIPVVDNPIYFNFNTPLLSLAAYFGPLIGSAWLLLPYLTLYHTLIDGCSLGSGFLVGDEILDFIPNYFAEGIERSVL
jgi:hypothetical protein